jgi:hypothetical protein
MYYQTSYDLATPPSPFPTSSPSQPPAAGARWNSALQLVTQLGEFVAAGHLAGEFVEGDFGAFLVQHGLAELEDDEVVPTR